MEESCAGIEAVKIPWWPCQLWVGNALYSMRVHTSLAIALVGSWMSDLLR